jgi:DNA-binding LacI/PurR family transcriptional regulator
VRDVARDLASVLLARPDHPTAVFAASDTQALGVLEAARAAGVVVPDELSVVGFDDIEVSSYAGLTTVRQPLFESGRLAASLLLEALTDGEPPVPETHELALDLVVRSTTAPPPVNTTSFRSAPARVNIGGTDPSTRRSERHGRDSS